MAPTAQLGLPETPVRPEFGMRVPHGCALVPRFWTECSSRRLRGAAPRGGPRSDSQAYPIPLPLFPPGRVLLQPPCLGHLCAWRPRAHGRGALHQQHARGAHLRRPPGAQLGARAPRRHRRRATMGRARAHRDRRCRARADRPCAGRVADHGHRCRGPRRRHGRGGHTWSSGAASKGRSMNHRHSCTSGHVSPLRWGRQNRHGVMATESDGPPGTLGARRNAAELVAEENELQRNMRCGADPADGFSATSTDKLHSPITRIQPKNNVITLLLDHQRCILHRWSAPNFCTALMHCIYLRL
mmetsp:Transcript_46936/g.133918  ORF Transcript_46936/g.133918 Transcript_46936/m.133918 type:complete len:299 (+) Transcript_46936:64-960(+)